MAHLYKKIKKGREYFYIRETQRVYGKPTTVNQVYLGTAEKVQALLEGHDTKSQQGFSPKEFGSIFVLNEIDKSLDLAGLVDEILPPKKRTKGPSLGELFFFAALNRAIDPTSKRKLAAWYEATDILRIRQVRLESLSSQNFWNHWNRVSDKDLAEIAHRFFQRVHSLVPSQKENLLLEISSYSSTSTAQEDVSPGEQRKAAKAPHQFWLALVTERTTGVPIYYQLITKAIQEKESLEPVFRNLLAKIKDLGIEVKDLTVILGKGTDSPALIDLVDSQKDLHLIAAYTPDFLPELAAVPLKDFTILPCKYNRRLLAEGEEKDQILYYETRTLVWDRPHKVAVTFDPRTFESQYQEFMEKIQKVRQEFVALQRKWQQGEVPEEASRFLEDHLLQLCQYLQLKPELIKVSLKFEGSNPIISLELQEEVVKEVVRSLGKTILVTDHEDWSGEEISEANIDRCIVEEQIRQTGITLQEVILPQYHWTESKLQVNIFVCMVALTYLILLHQRLHQGGLLITLKEALEAIRDLRTAVFWQPQEERLKRMLIPPTDTQLALLHALGFQVEEGKVISAK
jgi:transposase